MKYTGKELISQLRDRGLIAQQSAYEELEAHLDISRVLYCGFDPTADSLHLGHLVPLLVMKRFQMAGHSPIALVGGATGMIGDPSFKASERKLLPDAVISEWGAKIKSQVSSFIDFQGSDNSGKVVNNLEWIGELGALEFLRDVGKHFSVNNMITKESVKQRINREGSGISFTEFSYSLLQSYDFAELFRRYGCTLQIGGSDQWGNIIGGIELCRRQFKKACYGLTVPLITKDDGKKFGKTETETIWLDASKTSPFSFYQFWLNVADADVYRFLRFFTFLSLEEIERLEAIDKVSDNRPKAQKSLASEVTRLVHGENGLEAARRITEVLFSGDASLLNESDFAQLRQDGLPFSALDDANLPLTQLLVECGIAKSGREVKDALNHGSVFIKGKPKSSADNMLGSDNFSSEQAHCDSYFLVRLGKKKYHLFQLPK